MSETETVEAAAPPLPDGEYAIVEFYGHQAMVGRISEVERFGGKLLMIEPLLNGDLLSAVYHGGASIYRLTPCSAEVAYRKCPKHDWQLPEAVRATIPPALLSAPIPL